MRSVLLTLLCCITWIGLIHATHGPMINCACPGTSRTRPRIQLIVNYTIQSGSKCPEAVMLLTKSGSRTCSDPKKDWVKKAMWKVDQEKKALLRKEEDEQRSTSYITTTLSTVSKKAQWRRSKTRKTSSKKMLRERMKRQRQLGLGISSLSHISH